MEHRPFSSQSAVTIIRVLIGAGCACFAREGEEPYICTMCNARAEMREIYPHIYSMVAERIAMKKLSR